MRGAQLRLQNCEEMHARLRRVESCRKCLLWPFAKMSDEFSDSGRVMNGLKYQQTPSRPVETSREFFWPSLSRGLGLDPVPVSGEYSFCTDTHCRLRHTFGEKFLKMPHFLNFATY